MILYEDDNVRVEMHVTTTWDLVLSNSMAYPDTYRCAVEWADGTPCNTNSLSANTIYACTHAFIKKAK